MASTYDAVLPAMVLPRQRGGEAALGLVNACVGLAALAGSVLAAALPAPKNRVRAICLALLFSMSTEMQGRVYACRNTLQFFTIPLVSLFGAEKGSGAALLFAVIGVCGVLVCLVFGRALRRYAWSGDG